MTLDRRALVDAIAQQHEHEPFSGVVSVRERGEVVVEVAYGGRDTWTTGAISSDAGG